MFCVRKPAGATINDFIQAQTDRAYSYPELGATRRELPPGYVVDHNRLKLGDGSQTFERARRALRDWRMFDLGWLKLHPASAPIAPGVVVALVARHYAVWSLNACRIVYTIAETGPVEKLGFAYGTIADHAMSGEERFTVEWHHDDNTVWYDILAMSRPNHWLSRLAYPLARRLQKRFAADSLQAILKSVTTP